MIGLPKVEGAVDGKSVATDLFCRFLKQVFALVPEEPTEAAICGFSKRISLSTGFSGRELA
jgi:hypothetical protein